MEYPKQLVKKTKELFPENHELHEAIEKKDAPLVLSLLNQATSPMYDVSSQWFLLAMKGGLIKDPELVKQFFDIMGEQGEIKYS